MIFINKFVDKVSLIESRQGKDLVLSISDARGLRDELAKLLLELHNKSKMTSTEQVIQVEMKGASFK